MKYYIPISKFRRDINSWFRQIQTDNNITIVITRNGKPIAVMLAYERISHEKIIETTADTELKKREWRSNESL